MIPLLFINDEILIIDKPAGLAVQPGAEVKHCVLDILLKEQGIKGWLVHRLDKETAGCLVIARSAAAARHLSSIIESRLAEKTYLLAVFGRPATDSGSIDVPVQVQAQSRDALTHYKVLTSTMIHLPANAAETTAQTTSAQAVSLIEARLGTGRMHQIRQHFATAGWPLIGDDKYGNFRLNKAAAKLYGTKRLLLLASRLNLPVDPPVTVNAGIPQHFADFFQRCGLSLPPSLLPPPQQPEPRP